MKIKNLILGSSSIGLLAIAAPISFATTNQTTFTDLQNIQSLDVGDKLTEIKSINKSCENLVYFKFVASKPYSAINDITCIDSRIKIEETFPNFAWEGKIERDDLFTYSRTDTQYTSYHRYKSNHVEKNNHTSWGNAKKYQLNVTVPANTKEYKVQVVANVKIKNCVEQIFDYTYSFVQATLSQLSIDPNETLMPYIGIKDDNIYSYYYGHFHDESFKIITHNDLFGLFNFISMVPIMFEHKPYEVAELSSGITLSNKTYEAKVIPVYFWYGFFGGGFIGKGNGSHINCSEVTFSANHIE